MIIGVFALAVLTAGIRMLRARHTEGNSRSRLSTGPDGIIIGAEPLTMRGPAQPAVLLLHGFGDTPQSLAWLAQSLHGHGHTVRVPLFPGHGRSLGDFAETGAENWIDAARVAYTELRETHPEVAIVGSSMGGAIAVILASEFSPASLVLLAPYLGVPTTIRCVARAHRVASLFSVYWAGGGNRSIHDPEEQEKGLAYGTYTPHNIRELTRVVDRASAVLRNVTTPTLIIQSRHDNRVSMHVTTEAFGQIGASAKQLHWTNIGGHVIAVDYGKEKVFERVAEWIEGP